MIDRRILDVFRLFVEKVLLPELKRPEVTIPIWNSFIKRATVEPASPQELQSFVFSASSELASLLHAEAQHDRKSSPRSSLQMPTFDSYGSPSAQKGHTEDKQMPNFTRKPLIEDSLQKTASPILQDHPKATNNPAKQSPNSSSNLSIELLYSTLLRSHKQLEEALLRGGGH